MRIAIVSSTKDIAGMNIRDRTFASYDWKDTGDTFDEHPMRELTTDHHVVRYYTVNNETIHSEYIDNTLRDSGFDVEYIIFATRHQSQTGRPFLTVHSPGNWGKAEMGGEDRRLNPAAASILRFAMERLEDLVPSIVSDKFDVIQEVTHHGPYISVPCMFIEIGSDADRWQNEEAAAVIAKAIMHVLTNRTPEYKVAIGIGGLHNMPNFVKVMRRDGYAFSHICPKYMLEHLDKELIQQALDATVEEVDSIFVDWKGVGPHKEKIKQILDELGLPFEKIK